MDLNLAHLRTLHEVVRHGSFTRAAAARHLTRPAVGLHIRELEARTGQPFSHIAVAHEIETGELVGVRLRPVLSRRLALVYRRGKPMSTALEAVLAAVARHLRTRTRLRAG